MNFLVVSGTLPAKVAESVYLSLPLMYSLATPSAKATTTCVQASVGQKSGFDRKYPSFQISSGWEYLSVPAHSVPVPKPNRM